MCLSPGGFLWPRMNSRNDSIGWRLRPSGFLHSMSPTGNSLHWGWMLDPSHKSSYLHSISPNGTSLRMNALSSTNPSRKSSGLHGVLPAGCEHECTITPNPRRKSCHRRLQEPQIPPRSSIFSTHHNHPRFIYSHLGLLYILRSLT